jgi:hypothetical protein
MKTKAKKCKGTGKAKGYGCGNLVDVRTYGLGKFCCYTNWLLNTDEGREKLAASQVRAKKIVVKRRKAEWRKQKLARIPFTQKLQQEINHIARLIDVGRPCLARGIHARQMHAGHVYSRASTPSAKFNLHNIHRQSARSNGSQVEDAKMFDGLRAEYGLQYEEFIRGFKRIPALKFSNEEYQAFYRKAREIRKRLMQEGKTLGTEERIKMRNNVNKEINLYDTEYGQYRL